MLPPTPSLQIPQQQLASFGYQQNPAFGQLNQHNYGMQTQHSQQSFMPLNVQHQLQINPQLQTTPQIQFQVSQNLQSMAKIQQNMYNYQQQPFVVQNLIQPQPQIQYQQQIVQHPPIQITSPAQIERKVNYVPQKKQIVKMEEQEIEEIVPVERTIVEYIPVQTIIEKVPVPVEIPYEVRIPRPYEQEIYYPNDRNHIWTDQIGNPLQNPLQNPDDLNKQKQPIQQDGGGTTSSYTFETNVQIPEEQSDEEYDVLIEKYTRILEEIKSKKRRRRKQQGLEESDEDDFNFSKVFSGGRRGYSNYDYDDRYETEMRTSSRNANSKGRGYVGRGRNARDYIR